MAQEPDNEVEEASPYPILFIFTACTVGGKLQGLSLRGNVTFKLVS